MQKGERDGLEEKVLEEEKVAEKGN